jgi:hypothetical protein
MKVFDKVLLIIKNRPIYGHALRNIENKKSLIKAKIEIENMLAKAQ